MIKTYQNNSVIDDEILNNSIIIVNQSELNKYKLKYINYDVEVNTLDGYLNKLLLKNTYYSLASKEISLIFLREAYLNVKCNLKVYTNITNYDFYNILYNTYFFYCENKLINNDKISDLKIIYDEFTKLLKENNLVTKYDMYNIVLEDIRNISYDNIIFLNLNELNVNTLLFINKLRNDKNIYLYLNTTNNESFIDELDKDFNIKIPEIDKGDVSKLFLSSSFDLFKDVNIVACNDLYEETLFLYDDVVENVNSGLKYSDILIVSNDIEKYNSYFKQIFDIPINVKDSNNILVKYFNILRDILNGNFKSVNFINLLKLDLFDVKEELINKIDNYLYENILYDENFYDVDFKDNKLNEIKYDLINPLKCLLENTINEINTNEILKYLYMYLDEMGITNKFNLYDTDSYNKLVSVLEYINDYVKEIKISDLLNLLSILLSQSNVSLEQGDMINVCNLSDYHDNSYKKVYFIGCTLDDIPGKYKYNTLINNNDLDDDEIYYLIKKHYDKIYNQISNVLLNENVTITYHKLDDTPSKKEKSSLLNKFYNKPVSFSFELNKKEDKNLNLKLDKTLASKLYGNTLYLSPSSLEVYSKCSYSYFLKYGLKLNVKEKNEFDYRMVGTYVHYLLYKALKTNNDDFDLFTDEFIKENNLKVTNIVKYVLDELKKNTKMVLSFVKKELELSKFTSYKLEDKIDDLSFEIALENGVVKFKGIVDRIDKYEDDNNFYYRIIDYKTGEKKFKIDDILIGLNMQMLIYLLALKNLKIDKKIIPTGFLYCPGKIKYNSELIDEKDEIVLDNILKNNKMNGIISSDYLDLYDDDSFSYLDVKTRNNFNEEKVLGEKELDILFDGVIKIIKEHATSLLNGDIKINPIKDNKNDSCKYCKFNSICNFDIKIDKPRRYKSLSKKEVLDKLEGDINGMDNWSRKSD